MAQREVEVNKPHEERKEAGTPNTRSETGTLNSITKTTPKSLLSDSDRLR